MKIKLVKLSKCPKDIRIRKRKCLVVSPVKRYRLVQLLPFVKSKPEVIKININYLVW